MDNSRSMAENGCAGAACEATVLLARALTRLEVGSLGIVRFGGAFPPGELHPLGMPFTEAQGPSVLAGLRFDQVRAVQGLRSKAWGHAVCASCLSWGLGGCLACLPCPVCHQRTDPMLCHLLGIRHHGMLCAMLLVGVCCAHCLGLVLPRISL